MDPEAPTPRSSGTLPIFLDTVTTALERLAIFGKRDDRDTELYAEAQALLSVLGSWKGTEPAAEERAHIISRVLDLHRGVEEYVARVTRRPPP
jgi:hypothetical protein